MAARLLFDVNFGRRQRKQRVYRHFHFEFDADEYQQRYRFSQETVQYLANLLKPKLCRPTMRSQSLVAIRQVEMALRYYATGDNMKTIGDTMGFHVSSVCRSVRDVSQALVDIAEDYIMWPTSADEINNIKRGFYSIAKFPGVIGAVDGTHVRIIGPSLHENVYVNREGYNSLNVQGICDHQGRFINVVAKWPGSNHDSFIFRESDVGAFLETYHRGIDRDGVLLGDGGYACTRYLLIPYLRPNSEAQMRYNESHTRTRGIIERSFGWWKRRFMVLHGEIRCQPDRVAKIVVACAVLHNIAFERKEAMFEGDDNGEQGRVNDPVVPVPPRNENVRQFITDTYF